VSLRLRLKWDEELVQVIDKEGSLDWRYIDLSKIKSLKKQEIQLQQLQERDREERYNLEAVSPNALANIQAIHDRFYKSMMLYLLLEPKRLNALCNWFITFCNYY